MVLRPVPGVTGPALLDGLRATELALENVRGAGGTAVDRFNAYQRWANDEARRLGRLVLPADLDALVTTPRYWTLQALDPSSHGSLAAFIDLELDERLRAVTSARELLQQTLSRWSSRTGLLAVPDTNVYLHHDEYFDEVEWWQVLPSRAEDVHLVIPLLVVDELDNQKRSGRGRKVSDTNPEEVSTRARATLRRLDEWFQDPSWQVTIKPSRFPDHGAVTVELLLDEPGHVRLPRADDELVDQARGVQDLCGRTVHLVTFDTGAAFRGRAAELTVVHLASDA